MKQLLLIICLAIFAFGAHAQPLPFVDMLYSDAPQLESVPLGVPLKGHYTYASYDGKSLGMMEFGVVALFNADSTFTMKFLGYGGIFLDIEGTYRTNGGNLIVLSMTTVNNPEFATSFLHFFDVAIACNTATVETQSEKGYFITMGGDKAKPHKTTFQFTLSYLKKAVP